MPSASIQTSCTAWL